MSTASAAAVHCGDLPLGGGLLALVRPALALLEPGAMLCVHSLCASNRFDLPRWCQTEHHEYLGYDAGPDGDVHRIARGPYPLFESLGDAAGPTSPEDLGWDRVVTTVPPPPIAGAHTGLAPKGATVEKGGPAYPFPVHEADLATMPDVARLYEQATKNQWNGTNDIPWKKLRPLPKPLDWAVCQVMTFLAENELSALYLPSRFVSQIHPYYMESGMFLATQLVDEARHIEVFTKRAWACGGRPGISAVVTSRSLLSLLNSRDFLEATFILSVLGEGTFLDLLAFVESHAPDEVTETIVHRARQDETRHVHFGIAHVQHALSVRPFLKAHLTAAVQRRADELASVTGAPLYLQDALVLLAAGGAEPGSISKGHAAYRELLETMRDNRIRRLKSAGFDESDAAKISDLHTPNFM